MPEIYCINQEDIASLWHERMDLLQRIASDASLSETQCYFAAKRLDCVERKLCFIPANGPDEIILKVRWLSDLFEDGGTPDRTMERRTFQSLILDIGRSQHQSVRSTVNKEV